jgi:N-acetylglucosaminyldiphosphoundecaprenol N-acetyl-beta-D-mannosaminyltransferase
MLAPTCSPVAVLGVPFDNVTMDETVSLIEEQIREGGFHQVATANVDFLKNAMNDEHLHNILCSCDTVIPDGMPIVWMSGLLGNQLKERVSGVDLVDRLAQLAAERGYGVFLLGASEDRSRGAAKALCLKYPKLRIVGRFSPDPKPLGQMDHEAILERIHAAKPDILLVAFGNPKQERWISMHRNRLQVPVCIGVGGTFDFLSGKIRRAPQWMQRTGTEWLFRTLQEPRRLAVRYLSDAFCLLRHVPGYLASMSIQKRRSGSSNIVVRQVGNTRLISMIGDLNGQTLDQFNACSKQASDEGMNIVLDLSQTGYVGPKSLGSLITLGSKMRKRHEQLWLAAIPAHLRRILRSAQLHNYFMTTTIVRDALNRTAKMEQRVLGRFGPALRPLRSELSHVNTHVEGLQDVCKRIIGAEDPETSGFSPATFVSVGS